VVSSTNNVILLADNLLTKSPGFFWLEARNPLAHENGRFFALDELLYYLQTKSIVYLGLLHKPCPNQSPERTLSAANSAMREHINATVSSGR